MSTITEESLEGAVTNFALAPREGKMATLKVRIGRRAVEVENLRDMLKENLSGLSNVLDLGQKEEVEYKIFYLFYN